MRGKKREPRERALRLARTQANASTFEGILLQLRHSLAAANGGARADGGGAHEQHASLHGPIFVAEHRTSPLLLLQSTGCEVRFAVVEQVGFPSNRSFACAVSAQLVGVAAA